ncbi:unnamed protein product [Phytophthora lilii]|uniref:Unnamed protein product n=1 Tax=Phytophthora lilii TaxID=2077276 RepID=A0A9W6UD37_9STRA|nr:unnamed protein product [Phytophthora lilii]
MFEADSKGVQLKSCAIPPEVLYYRRCLSETGSVLLLFMFTPPHIPGQIETMAESTRNSSQETPKISTRTLAYADEISTRTQTRADPVEKYIMHIIKLAQQIQSISLIL